MKNNNESNDSNSKIIKKKLPFKSVFFFLALLTGVMTAVFFSSRYIFDHPQLGNSYGSGMRITVDLKNTNKNGAIEKTQVSQETLTKAENSIYKRTSQLNMGEPTILTNQSKDLKNPNIIDYSFTIIQPQIHQADKARSYVSQLVDKSNLSYYTANDNPLFDQNGYKKDLPKRKAGDKRKRQYQLLKADSVKYDQKRRGSRLLNTVSYSYNNPKARIEYGKALSALKSAKAGSNKLVAWIGYDGLWDLVQQQIKLKADYAAQWKASGQNLYKYVHNWVKGKEGKWTMGRGLRVSPFNASDYLISDAPVKIAKAPELGKRVYINNSFSPSKAKSLADRINYGSSSYKLVKLGDYSFVTAPYNKTRVNRLAIAAIIILALIIIFMIARYGIFGVISSLSLLLSVSSMLALLVVIKGAFTLLTLGSLIFSVLLILDVSIVSFEKLKKELYFGKSLIRGMKSTNKHSIKILFDSSFIIIVMSFILFYIGSRFIPGISIIMVLSIIFTIFSTFVFIKFLSFILVKIGTFDNKLYLMGVYPSKKESFIKREGNLAKINYSKHSKWFLIASAFVIFTGIITFSITSGISKSLAGGFNSNNNILGGNQVYIRSLLKKPDPGTTDEQRLPQQFTTKELDSIYSVTKSYSKDISSIQKLYLPTNKNAVNGIAVIFGSKYDTSNFAKKIEAAYNKNLPSDNLNIIDIRATSFKNFVNKSIVKKSLLSLLLLIIAIVIYVLVRFSWTLSLASLIALVHDGLIISSIFIITRLPFSSFFFIGLILVLFYAVLMRVLLLNQIKKNTKGVRILNKDQFKTIINKSLGETFVRNIVLTAIFLVITFILLVIPNSSNIILMLTMMIGALFSLISMYIIFPWIWIKIETLRFDSKQKHTNKSLWDVNVPQEETFYNINKFKDI